MTLIFVCVLLEIHKTYPENVEFLWFCVPISKHGASQTALYARLLYCGGGRSLRVGKTWTICTRKHRSAAQCMWEKMFCLWFGRTYPLQAAVSQTRRNIVHVFPRIKANTNMDLSVHAGVHGEHLKLHRVLAGKLFSLTFQLDVEGRGGDRVWWKD